MKKFVLGLILGLLLVTSMTALAAPDGGIRLIIDGRDISATMDVQPQIVAGRVMVPARYVAEELGATVAWDEVGRRVVIYDNEHVPTEPVTTPAPVTTEPVTPQPSTVEPSPNSSTADTPSTGRSSGTYLGSVDSDKYHYPGCRAAQTILQENEIWFETAEEAQRYGYTACGICKP